MREFCTYGSGVPREQETLLVTVRKMEEGPPTTISRSGCQTTVSCVDKESRW